MKKVSIVMPAYNASRFITESVNSVQNQTYNNWEIIIVNDASTDDTQYKLESMAKKDNRIKIINLEKNMGAAYARNIAVKNTRGEFIAFLDSDDTWYPKKLERQLEFMERTESKFSCTFYNKINENSENLDRIIRYPKYANYEMLLKYCPGNSTVIYNAEELGKFFIPNIKKRNDYIMWLKIIKESKYLNCLEEVLSSHRERSDSLSSNKKSLLKYHWIIYRKYEKLSAFKSSFLLLFWIKKTL
ncbi:glycosyltransferase family 2 protein, partial [Enterococcus faecium]|nr:glycosyltransferase family 2 protein [Enterococcus faecium]